MFFSVRFLSKPGSELPIRKYYANLLDTNINHNQLIKNQL